MLHFPRNHYDVPHYMTTWFYYSKMTEFSFVMDNFGDAVVSGSDTYAIESEWCYAESED